MTRPAVFNRFLKEDRWIPGLILLFFAGLVVLQMRFVYVAVSSYPGMVTDQPFQRGQRFNEILAEADAQRALGWKVTLAFDAPTAGVAGRAVVTVVDRQGQPVEGASVGVLAEILTRHAQAFPLALAADGPGRYAAPLTLPIGGRWWFSVEIRRGADVYREGLELFVAAKET